MLKHPTQHRPIPYHEWPDSSTKGFGKGYSGRWLARTRVRMSGVLDYPLSVSLKQQFHGEAGEIVAVEAGTASSVTPLSEYSLNRASLRGYCFR